MDESTAYNLAQRRNMEMNQWQPNNVPGPADRRSLGETLNGMVEREDPFACRPYRDDRGVLRSGELMDRIWQGQNR